MVSCRFLDDVLEDRVDVCGYGVGGGFGCANVDIFGERDECEECECFSYGHSLVSVLL